MKKETKKKIEEICQLHRAGKTRKQIAEEMFCSMSTIDRALHMYGDIPTRDSFEDHREKIMEMYQSGETLKRIAKETGISITTINRHLLNMGLCRGKGWKSGQGKRGYRKPISHREQREHVEEQEILTPLRYVDNRKRVEIVEIRGKIYQDVSAWYM